MAKAATKSKPKAAMVPVTPVVRRSRNLDRQVRYVLSNPTFTLLSSLIRAGDHGDYATCFKLCQEMEQRDGNLKSVASTRRMALTGMAWDVVSAAEIEDRDVDQKLADEAAQYCRETLKAIPSFPRALKHLATAVGTNLAVVEIVWRGGMEIDHFRPVMGRRLTANSESFEVRIITDEAPTGVPVSQFPGQFIVHQPWECDGSPWEMSLFRTCAPTFLAKRLSFADWVQFSELYGQPVRWAQFGAGVDEDEVNRILDMLENLGSSAFAAFSEAVTIDFKQANASSIDVYERLLNYCDRVEGKLWLGGNLVADTTGGTGTHAASQDQQEVRKDIRKDDGERLGDTNREQLLTVMCRAKFPGRDVAMPYFVCREPEVKDRQAEATLLKTVTQEIGLPVALDDAYATLELRRPEPDDELVRRIPSDPFATFEGGDGVPPTSGVETPPPAESTEPTQSAEPISLNDISLAIERLMRSGDTEMVNQLRTKLAAMLGFPAPPPLDTVLPEQGAAVADPSAAAPGVTP